MSDLSGCPFSTLDDWLAQVTPSVVTAKQELLDSLPAQHVTPPMQQATSEPSSDSCSQQAQPDPDVGSATRQESGASAQQSSGQGAHHQMAVGAPGTQSKGTSSLLSGTSTQLQSHQLVSLAAFAAAAAGQVSMHRLSCMTGTNSYCTIALCGAPAWSTCGVRLHSVTILQFSVCLVYMWG